MKKDKIGFLILILISGGFLVLFGILLIVRMFRVSDEILFIFQILTSALLGAALLFLLLSVFLFSTTLSILKSCFMLFGGMTGLAGGIITIATGLSVKDGVFILVYSVLLGISSIISLCIEPFMVYALENTDRK